MLLLIRITIALIILCPLQLKAQEEEKKLTAQYRFLQEVPCQISNLQFSSNGLGLAYACDGDIYYLTLKEPTPIRVTATKFRESNPVWSPDGSKIAYQKDSTESSSIWVYSTISKVHTRVNKIKENCFNPSWAPNGRTIAFSTDTYGSVDVMIKDFDYNKERRLTAARGDEFIFGFHPSGKFVGYYERGTEEEDIYAVSLTGKEALPLTRSEALELNPTWSYDGSKVLFLVQDEAEKVIYTSDFPYGESSTIDRTSSSLLPIISAKGEWVIYEKLEPEKDLYLYNIKRRNRSALGLNEFDRINEMAWSIGGRIIAFSTIESNQVSKIWLGNISAFLKAR